MALLHRFIMLIITLGQTRTIQVRTRDRPDTSEHPAQELPDDREDAAKNGRANRNGGLQHHSLELCREGEKKAPPPAGGNRGNEPIGTLSCSTLLYTEKSWRTQASVESISQPRETPILVVYFLVTFRAKL